MNILNSTKADLLSIFNLYDAAIAHQKAVSNMHWLPFDRTMVEKEIEEGRQWKIMIDGQIACIFATTYSDRDIWGDQDADPSIYVHRIVTNPDFRGRNFVAAIVAWAREHCPPLGKRFIRLDTWAENLKLKEVYLRAGFRYLGIVTPANPEALPSHYSGISLALFEIDLAE